jgi:hypothetical protein
VEEQHQHLPDHLKVYSGNPAAVPALAVEEAKSRYDAGVSTVERTVTLPAISESSIHAQRRHRLHHLPAANSWNVVWCNLRWNLTLER